MSTLALNTWPNQVGAHQLGKVKINDAFKYVDLSKNIFYAYKKSEYLGKL